MPLYRIALMVLAAAASGGALFAVLVALKLRYLRWFGVGHGLLTHVMVILAHCPLGRTRLTGACTPCVIPALPR